jgi:hypothetical protein
MQRPSYARAFKEAQSYFAVTPKQRMRQQCLKTLPPGVDSPKPWTLGSRLSAQPVINAAHTPL